MFCDSLVFCFFVSFSFLWIFCNEYLCLYLRRERISSADWEASSLLMSCFLMLDNVPVKDLSPPASLTFNTSVSSNPLSLYPACLLYVWTWKSTIYDQKRRKERYLGVPLVAISWIKFWILLLHLWSFTRTLSMKVFSRDVQGLLLKLSSQEMLFHLKRQSAGKFDTFFAFQSLLSLNLIISISLLFNNWFMVGL